MIQVLARCDKTGGWWEICLRNGKIKIRKSPEKKILNKYLLKKKGFNIIDLSYIILAISFSSFSPAYINFKYFSFYFIFLAKCIFIHSNEKNHKIRIQVYKIQISNSYIKIISIYILFDQN